MWLAPERGARPPLTSAVRCWTPGMAQSSSTAAAKKADPLIDREGGTVDLSAPPRKLTFSEDVAE